MITLQQTAKLILEKDNFHILTHQMPDGDTLGSGFALCKALQNIGKNAKVIIVGEIPEKYQFLTHGIKEQSFECEYVISVDIADIKLLGANKEAYIGKIDLAIDHHESHIEFAKNTYLEAHTGANAMIIYKILKEMDITFDKDIANSIYTGICTDTGCFKYSNVEADTFRIAADMIDLGADFYNINREMFDTKSKARIELDCEVLKDIKYLHNDRTALIYVSQDLINRTGVTLSDIDGLSSIPRKIHGVKIGITIREKEDGTFKCSIRSLDGYSASKICGAFGGGGHTAAAGFTSKDTLENIINNLDNFITNEYFK